MVGSLERRDAEELPAQANSERRPGVVSVSCRLDVLSLPCPGNGERRFLKRDPQHCSVSYAPFRLSLDCDAIQFLGREVS